MTSDKGIPMQITNIGGDYAYATWEKDKEERAYANIVIPIKYVHQLQHALRLVGMTDMANNFKI